MPISASKRWNFIPDSDPQQVHRLTQALSIAPEIAALLVQRGIDTPEAAAAFFNPDLRQLPDPLLMRDMDRAVARLAPGPARRRKGDGAGRLRRGRHYFGGHW